MTRLYEGIADAADDVGMAVGAEDGIPPFVLDKVYPYVIVGASPVDRIVYFAETVYANADDCSADVKDIAGGCALVCEMFGFHGMNVNSRGSKIAAVLNGATIESPPAPKPELTAPVPEE
jgi:hypothetical protein